ncbi:hypothetical protein SCATT_19670 [Streptantibioticus cattleyicolor NRRL 8057 = DSM 46488]|uniref:Uncharacterized protein n=1 Tax=Streptantibioticus cattleyicolor (strain ATCC 35852 / DSM 46488 / JCM 4925 / NBRC 14057 / NRRL 8057) TaxID=1003195 RepID=G8WWD1_STREN|nr:hypothetical protein SCATT_19670 [Streptantibioticus cattleyicolor NRRL 8057 = DSM 46488]
MPARLRRGRGRPGTGAYPTTKGAPRARRGAPFVTLATPTRHARLAASGRS